MDDPFFALGRMQLDGTAPYARRKHLVPTMLPLVRAVLKFHPLQAERHRPHLLGVVLNLLIRLQRPGGVLLRLESEREEVRGLGAHELFKRRLPIVERERPVWVPPVHTDGPSAR